MDTTTIIILALLALYLAFRMMPTKGIRNITTMDLKNELKDQSKQFIDVRTSGEFKSNHIQGFRNMPLGSINHASTQHLSREKEVVVICQSGMRSNKASKQFKKLGFKKVTNVKGGMSAWS